MKISYNWLSTHIKTELDIQKIAEILTSAGLEVEGTEKTGTEKASLDGVIVGKVIGLEKHPNADKLRVATVDVGNSEPLQIVCGAPNVAEEQKVPVATIGTVLSGPDGKEFTIKKSKLRGVESFGMICSEAELGVSDNHDGIWVLEPSYKIGAALKDFIEISDSSDTMIEIGLTPNRTDAMSHYGVARDLKAALMAMKINHEFHKFSEEKFDSLNISGDCPVEVEIKNPELAPRYSGLYFENLTIKESPEWLQERLKTIGLNPINNVVDITNYILHDLGQPLHAFDSDKISGGKVIVQTLKKGTKFTTLDGVERELNGTELMICDDKGGMCMAGIYGGLDSGVSENTKRIFLESAYFDPISVRKSSKYHGLNTDSSFRFERGCDPNMTINALKKAAMLLIEYADAEIKGGFFDFYPEPIQNFQTVLRYHKADQLLGERLHREQIKEILKSLDIEIVSESNDALELSVPPFRADVQREADVIEEILRIYGYNNIKTPEKISFSIVKNQERNSQLIENTVAQALVSIGFHEAMNNSVGKSENISAFSQNEDNSIRLLNPLSSDLAVMRQSLMPGLLENTEFNINHKTADLKLFEFGKIYSNENGKYKENYRLGLLISGNKNVENWANPAEKTNFYTLKGIVFSLFERLGIGKPDELPAAISNYSDALKIEIDGKELGVIGKIDKKILKKTDIGQDVFFAELDWNRIAELAEKSIIKFSEISKFPAVKRDLALLIDKKISYKDLYDSAEKLKIKPLKSIRLFDVFEGGKLPEGKKSYALTFVLRNNEKTMSDSEIDEIMNKLIRNFEHNFHAELRN